MSLKLILSILVLKAISLSFLHAQIRERIDSLAKVHQAKGFNGNVLYSKNDCTILHRT